MMRVMEAADATTFWHEWFHAISPMLTAKDWEAVDTIEIDPTAFKREYGKKWEFPKWEKKYDAQGNLLIPKGKELDGLREKLSYGSEKYHRDENLHDFHITYEAREILKKIKKLFVETYKKWLPATLYLHSNSARRRRGFTTVFMVWRAINFLTTGMRR